MNAIVSIHNNLIYLALVFMWIAGAVIAQGFWSTVCCLCPLWSFYLVVERFMMYLGVV